IIAAGITSFSAWHSSHMQVRIAVLDIGEIYRLKEAQFSALLLKPGATEADRQQALTLAKTFGIEMSQLTGELPQECHCIVIAKAAVVAADRKLPDLTPEVKRRMGLGS